MSRVCIVGGTSVDTVIHLDQFPAPMAQTLLCKESYRGVGSTGAGKALNLSALGLGVCLHSIVGDDPEAQLIRDALQHPGIHLLLELTPEPTEQHVNLMTPDGQRLSIFAMPSPATASIDLPSLGEALAACEIVVVNILNYTRPVLELARTLGKPVWTDLHDYDGQNVYHQEFIDAASVLFLSSENLPDYRGFMAAAIAGGKELVVCTHGSAGATLLNAEGNWLEQPAMAVATVVDSNGAGDAFFSGFLFGYLKGRPLRECMALGAAAGALCVGSKGLVAEGLTAAELNRMAIQ